MDILVVDDDAEYAEIVANALRSRYPALKVEVDRHGAEAIEKTLEHECPSLVLANYKMHTKGGQLLGKMLKQSYGKRIKVLLMAEPQVNGSIEHHIEGLLEKPVDLANLYSAVDAWLAGGKVAETREGLVHFYAWPKASRGKHGIVIPRETLSLGGIDLNEEYDVYLKRATRRKKGNGRSG